ncbi:hypothetical protein CYLTODRAFT_424035 [Cylindrobasidium torrendii FP15055 ss-10]|uniref:histone deacetylase n=1 Tax=Cylindrobasidium torrendii FP15055 ss-10 TaxID=1314674 RepID=A0A0D7B6G6_9AGAR|nr:hypothetical protein CYLTODRAFT_424035 [Cylindrobasidium torrendii FP15055 ss-10]
MSAQPYFLDRGPIKTATPFTTAQRVQPHSRPIVSYYFPKGVGAFHYGAYHPMKPHRLTLTNALVLGYGLDKKLHNIYDVRKATREELLMYHDADYIDFLSQISPANQHGMAKMVDQFNCGEDSPVWDGLYDFCRMSSGGSLQAARKLCARTTDIAINWAGGLHHAKRGEASGFCYTNDIVLAILELLRYHPRVLYIDIDIHHGDGVEFAFYDSDRVMTVSFHKYTGEFFPGTGKLDDNGVGKGKNFCLNVPLLDGIDNDMYLTIFRAVIGDTVATFAPSAIVLQCGADSLGLDRLGAFNLSIATHGECVNFVRSFNVPLLVLGGGGYTIKNVSRCWTYETSVLAGVQLPHDLPATVYDKFFEEDRWQLHPPLTGTVVNQNTPASLQHVTVSIKNKLRYLQGAPSVAMQEIPPSLTGLRDDEDRTHEEKMEGISTARAGEDRRDRHFAENEFFDGDVDVDMEPEPVKSKGRGGKGKGKEIDIKGKGRAKGKGKEKERDDEDEDNEDEEEKPKKPVSRRGRGRPRGRGGRGGRGGKRRVSGARDDDEDDVGSTSSGGSGAEAVAPPPRRTRGGRMSRGGTSRGGRGGGRVKSAAAVEDESERDGEADKEASDKDTGVGGENMDVD